MAISLEPAEMLSLLCRTSPTMRTGELCMPCKALILSATSPRPCTSMGWDRSPSPMRCATALTAPSERRMRCTTTHDSTTSSAGPATPATSTVMRQDWMSSAASHPCSADRRTWQSTILSAMALYLSSTGANVPSA